MEIAILVAAAALGVGFLAVTQRQFLYFPQPREMPPIASVFANGEEVRFTTTDGLSLAGWFVPAATGGRAPAVLVLNGNAGNRFHRAPLAHALSRAGFAVLLFDYRGYGGNPGSPTEAGLLHDARAARAYLASRVGADRIAYFGESLGAAVAIALAAEHPPLALILRSPFTSVAEIGAHHYPYLPVHDRLLQDTYPSIGLIGRIRVPVLVIAGERDAIVPPAFSRRLYDAAAEPARYVLVPGADHNDLELFAGPTVVAETVRIIRDRSADIAPR